MQSCQTIFFVEIDGLHIRRDSKSLRNLLEKIIVESTKDKNKEILKQLKVI